MAVDPNNKVTVTARDIEFDNFTSNTGKWNSATMTLMVLDNETEGLQEYDEKLVAVFKKHGTSETVSFSAVIDGVDTRITTTDALDPSAKYELDGIYGEDTEQEYTTTSKFYFQVPGKKWDFANDTVDGDVNLVSGWHNYGYIKDINDVIHGVTNPSEFIDAVSMYNDTQTFTVNGVTMNRTDVKGVKYSSMMDEDLISVYQGTDRRRFVYGYNNLEEVDVVSCKLTRLFPDVSSRVLADKTVSSENSVYCLSGSKFNQRVAMPETLVVFSMINNNSGNYTQPVYIPPSVKQICNSFYSFPNMLTYDKKIVFSPNIYKITDYNFLDLKQWNHSLDTFATNRQLKDGRHPYWFMNNVGFNKPYTIPSTWTYIPNYFMYEWNNFAQELVIPDNITEIHGNGKTTLSRLLKCTGLTFSKNLVDLEGARIDGLGGSIPDSENFAYIKNFQDTKIAETPIGFLSDSHIDFSYFGFPNTLTNIKNGFMNKVKWQNLPVDEDGFDVFEIPEGITRFGGFNQLVIDNKKFKLVLPSTIQSVNGNVISHCVGRWWSQSITPYVKVDLSKIDPSIWRDEGTATDGSFTVLSSSYYMPVEITVAPGTVDAWKAKIPDIPGTGTEGRYYRKIVWKEATGDYGTIIYTNDSQETLRCNLSTEEDYRFLGDDSDDFDNIYVPSKDMYIARGYIIGFEFGLQTPSYTPPNFLFICNVETLNEIPSSITSIGNGFLNNCTYFNSPITIPSSVTSIGNSFMEHCSHFNSQITIPSSVTSIGNSFMSYCEDFNRPITIPSSVTSIGNYFMFKCDDFYNTITVNTLTSPNDPYSLATYSKTAELYTIGATLAGPGANTWINALPRHQVSPYRYLKLG